MLKFGLLALLLIKLCVRNFSKLFQKFFFLEIILQFAYLKVDQIDAVANEKFNTVNVSVDNSDPEKTFINFRSQLTTDKELVRAKVCPSQ